MIAELSFWMLVLVVAIAGVVREAWAK